MPPEITHEENSRRIMSEFARAFRGVLDNARPQETVEVGLIEGGGSSGGSGAGGVVGGSGGI